MLKQGFPGDTLLPILPIKANQNIFKSMRWSCGRDKLPRAAASMVACPSSFWMNWIKQVICDLGQEHKLWSLLGVTASFLLCWWPSLALSEHQATSLTPLPCVLVWPNRLQGFIDVGAAERWAGAAVRHRCAQLLPSWPLKAWTVTASLKSAKWQNHAQLKSFCGSQKTILRRILSTWSLLYSCLWQQWGNYMILVLYGKNRSSLQNEMWRLASATNN